MQTSTRFRVVLVTAPDLETARRLARIALESRLAACANLIPRIESHYWWKGRIESGAEVLVVFKTDRRSLAALEKCIGKEHPYDTPEFVVIPLAGGNRRYLDWLAASISVPKRLRPSGRPRAIPRPAHAAR